MFTVPEKLATTLKECETQSVPDNVFYLKSDRPLEIEAECLTEILSSDYGQSVLCKLVSSDTAFQCLEEQAREILPADTPFKNYVNEEKFFLKLLIKDNKYVASITPSCNVDKPEKSGFTNGAELDITLVPNMWIRFEKGVCTAGMFMNIKKVIIDGGRKKKTSKK